MAAKHQSAYRKRLAEKGRQEITVVVSNATADALRQVAKDHGQTQGRVLELGLAAAKRLLDQRLQPAAKPKQPLPARIIARLQMPQERAVAPSQPTADTNTPAASERTPEALQREPGQAMVDDTDARIRACAFAVEP